jgi:hypothetical protein
VLVEAQAVGANAKAATADLGPLRADVESNLRKVEQLVNDINRKWPFKRNRRSSCHERIHPSAALLWRPCRLLQRPARAGLEDECARLRSSASRPPTWAATPAWSRRIPPRARAGGAHRQARA